MPDETPILNLPYILPSQAQKHVTHNEAIRLLDVIVQLSVTARNLATPPTSPAQGDRYLVASGGSGDWAGQSGKIAFYENGAWQFIAPIVGWTAWVVSEQTLASFTGTAWVSQADGPFNVGQLGISTTPDSLNRLAVSSPATLLNHAGAGHQLKINKAAASDTASLLFQTGFSGRAEMGTAGSDDFAIKVSADGSAFVTGLSIAAGTGQVTLPVAARLGGQPNDPASPPNGTIWLNTTTGEVKLRSAGATVVLASGALGLADGDKGDITVTGGGANWVIDAGAVGNAKLASMPNATFKARISAGSGAPEDISPADAATLLPVFSTSTKGVVPASGGGATNFLRADGTWATPSAGGGSLSSLGLSATAAEIDRVADLNTPPPAWLLMGDPSWNLWAGAGDVGNLANWPASITMNGISSTKVGYGEEDGIPYVDVRFQGTATGSVLHGVIDTVLGRVPAITGQPYTASAILRRIGGSATGITANAMRIVMYEETAPGTHLAVTYGNGVIATSDTVASVSRTIASGNQIRLTIDLNFTNGAAIDVTYRIKGAQLELGAARTNGRYKNVSPMQAAGLLGVAGRNLIINGRGRVNQRGAVSGAATTGANQFMLDRWFVVTSGQSLSWTGNDARRVMTAPTGGVRQVVDGANITGGTYVLNWFGTATATVNGTARAKGEPFTLAANTNAVVAFANGTFTDVQLELGTFPTAYEAVLISQDQRACQRFYRLTSMSLSGVATAGGQDFRYTLPFETMRVVPAVAWFGGTSVNATSGAAINVTTNSATVRVVSAVAGQVFFVDYTLILDAELTA